MQPMVWLGLGYSIPAEPSKNRVYVWRKLKELGASYFKPGVALLPNTAQNLAKLTALAAKIREMGGEAALVEIRFLERREEEETVERFRQQSEAEYRELLRDCAGLMADFGNNLFHPAERSDRLRKIVKRFNKIRSRDFFRSRSRGDIAIALDDLAGDMAKVTDDVGRQIRNLLD